MAQEKQLSTITEGKGAIPFSPKVNTSTVYDENGQPLNVVLRSVDGKFKECSHSIGEQREKTEGLQDTINGAALHNGEVQAAVLVNIASGTGLTAVNAQQAFAEIAREIYPVQVTIAESNAGTFEIGTRKTPHIVLSILRNGADVSSLADTTSSQGEVQSDHKTIIGSEITSGTTTFQISVSQGGQTVNAPNQVFKFLPYVYGGELSNKPANANAVKAQLESWGSSHGVLSDKTDSKAIVSVTGNVPLSANKYYLFAVKGSYNFIVKNASSGGVISVNSSDMGKNLTINRVNGSGTDNYSWIIVPASPNSWTFRIENS